MRLRKLRTMILKNKLKANQATHLNLAQAELIKQIHPA